MGDLIPRTTESLPKTGVYTGVFGLSLEKGNVVIVGLLYDRATISIKINT